MSRKSNPTLIGAFVIGAVALVAIAVALFGGAEWFATRTQVVSYFPSSVKGLRVGSNVLFRGVRVGYVNEIQILGDVDTLETTVQVKMEIFPEQFKLTQRGVVIGDAMESDLTIQDVIDAGMRAQLDVESFVTGQLLIELDLHPETPPLYRSENPPYTEIPSIPSNIQLVLDKVQTFVADVQGHLDIEATLADVQNILDGLNELVNSSDVRETLAGMNRLVNAEDVQSLATDTRQAVADLRRAIAETRQFVRDADAQIDPLIDSLLPAIDRLDATLAAGEETLRTASAQIKGDTELAYELSATMNEVQGAARNLRVFLDYLERNPEALIRGKRGE